MAGMVNFAVACCYIYI